MNQPLRIVTLSVCMAMLTGLVGCSSINSLMEVDRIDYKSAGKTQANKLEIPPDLTQLQRDGRYMLPERASGTITASGYSSQHGAKTGPDPVAVAPREVKNIRMERSGNQRWLVVNRPAQELWPQIKEFWQDNGFILNIDSPQTGVMETDWAENRAKIPQGFLRSMLGKAIDSVYDSGERDKFRTRLERVTDGSTEIYISHRGAQEELVGAEGERTRWVWRPSNPELEAEFLSRLMVRLGTEQERAKEALASTAAVPQQTQAKLIKGANGAFIESEEGFDRLWRRVGLALDRVAFTVEDRDRSQGIYYVRYVDQDADAKTKESEPGFFARLFSSKKDKDKTAQRYRIAVKSVGGKSQISVLNNEGQPENTPVADKILNLLYGQLK